MARISRVGIAGLVALALALCAVAPAMATAEGGLSGRWTSDSLRDNRIGYFLVLKPGPRPAVGYVGHLRFEYMDGRRNPRMPVRAQVMGDTVIITAREGTFDRSGRVLRGVLDPGTGALTLTNCLDRLRLVMANALDSDCVLRPSR